MCERKAQQEADRIASELAVDHRLRDRRESPELGKWIHEYLKLREPDLSESTMLLYRKTGEYLVDHFGEHTRVSRIGEHETDQFRSWLLGKKLADETVRGHLRRASSIFKKLVVHNAIGYNPFDHLPKACKAVGEHGDVEGWMIPKLLDACPDASWRSLVAMTCYAGLRLSESKSMKWDRVLFDQNRLVVINEKTGRVTGQKTREVLMVPELAAVLAESHSMAESGHELVCTNSFHNASKNMALLVKRAGIRRYPRPFHSWRSWRTKTWKQEYPEYVVHAWLGHSASVSIKHYSRIDESHYGGESEMDRLRRENNELRQMLGGATS